MYFFFWPKLLCRGENDSFVALERSQNPLSSPRKSLKRDLKQTTTATAPRTSLIKRFNEQNNGCARAL